MMQFRLRSPMRHALTAATCLGAIALATLAHAQSPPSADYGIQGVWWPIDPGADVRPIEGSIVYTAAGKAALEKNLAKIRATSGKPKERDDLAPCLPAGPVRILQQPYPVQVIQKDKTLTLIYEHNHVFEIVYLGESPGEAEKADPSYMGYSTGEWAKGTLVVKSSNFNGQTMLSDVGVPHSDSLSITRKVRTTGQGRHLEVVSTISDPTMFKKPWTVRQVLEARPLERIEEYVCGQATLETRYTRQAAAAK